MTSINQRLKSFDLPSSLRSRRGWEQLFELKRSAEPHIHQIEPTNHCPYRCIMCPRTGRMTRSKGYMEFKLYSKIIDEIVGYGSDVRNKEIELFHFGESLLHPEIAEMVGYASKKGLKVVLSVNAPMLSSALARSILKQQPHRIVISMDGYDEASYRKIRGPQADYARAIQNIKSLLRIADGIIDLSRITIRMILLHANSIGVPDFYHTWSGSGANIEVRDFFPWNLSELADLGHVEKYPPYMPCPFPWQYLVVQWNGDVVPCCRDFNGANVLGNIQQTTLKEIWNGPSAVDFREQMASGRYSNAICRECMQIYYTEE